MENQFDTITYVKQLDGTFTKTIVIEKVVNVAGELAALEAQLADFKAGVPGSPEDQAKVDAAIIVYEAAVVVLTPDIVVVEPIIP